MPLSLAAPSGLLDRRALNPARRTAERSHRRTVRSLASGVFRSTRSAASGWPPMIRCHHAATTLLCMSKNFLRWPAGAASATPWLGGWADATLG
eukprot:CAMPEP_0197926850 /NCGR_PEP_ID=MMETSP1439-20131203/99795_1 /TAXON_ID=66791 /ORGANISM="Gonyaulax spinifera, Strain CCMP409" /LENGTH=93 /DNA_ID=CAMNT_0043549399 /DNA_START=158 /DNA_END=435 /DNA_ORIENTATION=-